MAYRELKSEKKCKDCGAMALSWQVGWENPETKEIQWGRERHYNHCSKCRSEKSKRRPAKKRENYSPNHGKTANTSKEKLQ